MIRLREPVTVKDSTWSPHFPPGIVWSQLMAKGVQIRQPARMVANAHAAMKTMTLRVVQMTTGTAKTAE